MKSRIFAGLSACVVLLTHAALAQNAALEAPPPPPQVQSGERLEPEVTIIERQDETVYEYRVNGQLYKVRVQPKVGPAYYFLDTDGDGQLDARQNEVIHEHVPQWLLFRF